MSVLFSNVSHLAHGSQKVFTDLFEHLQYVFIQGINGVLQEPRGDSHQVLLTAAHLISEAITQTESAGGRENSISEKEGYPTSQLACSL